MSAKTADGPRLLPETRELAGAKTFAAVSTHLPTGRIQTQVIWVDVSDDKILLNTETHRVKYLNATRDPVVTVLLRSEDDPYCYAEVRGRVTGTITGDRARAHVDEIARKYTGGDYPPDNIKTERVLLEITPDRQTYVNQSAGVAAE